jgi:lysophospholipase L1-like esterase
MKKYSNYYALIVFLFSVSITIASNYNISKQDANTGLTFRNAINDSLSDIDNRFKHLSSSGGAGKEDKFNKYTSSSMSGTSSQYPTAPAVKGYVDRKNQRGNAITMIGDSLTKGSPSPSTSFVPYVFDHFSTHFGKSKTAVINQGVPGNNSTDVLARLTTGALTPDTKAVVLMIGNNDSGTYNHETLANFEANLRAINTAVKNYVKKFILMVTPGVWEAAPSFPGIVTNAGLAPYQQKTRDVAAELGIDLVDNSAIPQNGTYYRADGSHLTDEGATIIYQNLMPVLLRVLGFSIGDDKKLGVGTVDAQTPLHIHLGDSLAGTALYSASTTLSTSTQDNASSTDMIVADSTGTSGYRGSIRGIRARGTLITPLVPLVNDYVLTAAGGIWDGANVQNTAELAFKVDGTVSAGVAPQRMTFSTKTGGSGAYVERFVVKNDGAIQIGTGPLKFPDSTTQTTAAKLSAGGVGDTYIQITDGTGGFTRDTNLYMTGSLVNTADIKINGGTGGAEFWNTIYTKYPLGSGSTVQRVNAAGTATEDSQITSNSTGVGINTASPKNNLDIYSSTATPIALIRDERTTAGAGGGLRLFHNNATGGYPSSADQLGFISFGGFNATPTARSGAVINSLASETWTSSTNAADLLFKTTITGAISPTERLRIKSTGAVKFVPQAAPSSCEEGDCYWDSTSHKLTCCTTAGTPGSWAAAW